MDIFVLKALADDLRQHLCGALVSKVFQMSPYDVLVRLWRHQDLRLLLSTQPQCPRLHLTTVRFRNPPQPLRFAAFLRAHLSDMRLADITVRPYDRVLYLHWGTPEAAGPRLTLIHELYGPHSNLVLVDTAGVVLEALKRSPGATASSRLVMPGQRYQPRPQPAHRRGVSALTVEDLTQLQTQGQFAAQGLQRLVVGLSATLAAELVHRSQGQPRRCWELLQELLQHYDQGRLTLTLCTTAQGLQYLSALPLTHCAATMTPYDSAQEAVTAFYEPLLGTTHVEERRATLHKTVAQRLQKLRHKMTNLTRDYTKLESYLPYQHYGTLLLTQQVPRGTPSVTLVNYYSPTQDTITIALDPRLSLQDNAQAYFKKYRKAKSGLAKVQALREQCRHEEHMLNAVAQQITHAEAFEHLETLATALQAAPVTPQPRPRTPVPTASTSPYRIFVLSDGSTLYCGKSDQSNDALVRHVASPEDIWLHAHRQAGAHVVLKTHAQGAVSDQTLHQAAALAAFYSKGKEAPLVEVMYAYAKHVHKFRGARPGQVRVTEYHTLAVAPKLPEED